MSKEIIKQHKSRNQYILSDGYWVRDLTKPIKGIDINHITKKSDIKLLSDNELINMSRNVPEIGTDPLPKFEKIIIVSDGYQFSTKKHFLKDLPADVCVIGINGALKNWLTSDDGLTTKKMNFYFVNNPFPQCSAYLPNHKHWPKCIFSIRTDTKFIERYQGLKFYYIPTTNLDFGTKYKSSKMLDDYRNPLCGALHLSYLFGAKKIATFCCDDSFKSQRPGAIQLPNKLWTYPYQNTANAIIDGMLYWICNKENANTKVVDHSSGLEYKNANYIPLEGLSDFFK